MNAATLAAILTPTLAIAGTGIAATVRLTRLVDAVESLERTMKYVLRLVEDHERRLTRRGL